MVAAASAVAAATGLRLCGMVEEPPRPSPAGSKASPTSVCIISGMSRAILPQVPAMMANTAAASAMRSRWVCQGASGSGRFEFLRQRFRHRQSLVAEGGERAGGAAELQRQRLAAQPPQASARAVQGGRIFRQLQPERHRQRVLQPGARHHRGVAMLPGQSGKARHRPVEIAVKRVDPGAEHRASWRCRSRPGWWRPNARSARPRVRLGDISRQRLDQRDRQIAGSRRGLRQRGEVE